MGFKVGEKDGLIVEGVGVGKRLDGFLEGELDGKNDIDSTVGLVEGLLNGEYVGKNESMTVGSWVRRKLGNADGTAEGWSVGDRLGKEPGLTTFLPGESVGTKVESEFKLAIAYLVNDMTRALFATFSIPVATPETNICGFEKYKTRSSS